MAQAVNDFANVLAKHGVDQATPADSSWHCIICKAGLELALGKVLTDALGTTDPATALAGLVSKISASTGIQGAAISAILGTVGLDGNSVQDIIDEIIVKLCEEIGACT